MAGESLTNSYGGDKRWLEYGIPGPVQFFTKVENDFYETLSMGLGGV
jgi:hypothetical protein